MITKVFEVRDRMTFLPVLAVKVGSEQPENSRAEVYLIDRAGFGRPLVILIRLEGSRKAEYDPFAWSDRTMHTAHLYIEDRFDELVSGDVVDVEYILQEKPTPKISERLEDYE